MTNGNRLSIENCVISNFPSGKAVSVTTAATVRVVDSLIRDNDEGVHLQGGAAATISGSQFLGNGSAGVYVNGTPASTTTTAVISDSIVADGGSYGVFSYGVTAGAVTGVSVTRSTISGNGWGVLSTSNGGTAALSIGESMLTRNGTAFYQYGGTATLESLGNNNVRQNSSVISGALTTVSPM